MLNAVRQLYSTPLLTGSDELKKKKGIDCISKQQAQGIFSTIDTIADLNSKFLQDINKLDANPADIFLKWAHFFNMYTTYASNKPSANRLLHSIMDDPKYSGFQNYHAECVQNPVCKGNSLESLLIMPVQRVPRYVLLLQAMIKHCPTEATKQKLQQAMTAIAAVGEKINEATRAQENRHHIHELQTKLGIPLVGPSRVYLKEGTLKLVNRKEKPTDLSVYVFNDLLVGGKFSKVSHTFTPSMQFDCDKQHKLKVERLEVGSVPYFRLFDPHDSNRKKKNETKYKTWSSALLKSVTDFVSHQSALEEKPMVKMNPLATKEGFLMMLVADNGEPINTVECEVGEDGNPVVAKESWMQRYFVLCDTSLKFYDKYGDKDAIGTIDLSNGGKLIEESEAAPHWQLPFCFYLQFEGAFHSGSVSYVLSGGPNGKGQRATWIANINQADPESIIRETRGPVEIEGGENKTEEQVHHALKISWCKAGTKLAKTTIVHLEMKSKEELDDWIECFTKVSTA